MPILFRLIRNVSYIVYVYIDLMVGLPSIAVRALGQSTAVGSVKRQTGNNTKKNAPNLSGSGRRSARPTSRTLRYSATLPACWEGDVGDFVGGIVFVQ